MGGGGGRVQNYLADLPMLYREKELGTDGLVIRVAATFMDFEVLLLY